jgi:hypothetical protein
MHCGARLVIAGRLFDREHHRRVLLALQGFNAQLLRDNNCLFGGGSAIALRYGEYRESVDIDFLVSDAEGYGALRQLLTGVDGIAAVMRERSPLIMERGAGGSIWGKRPATAS